MSRIRMTDFTSSWEGSNVWRMLNSWAANLLNIIYYILHKLYYIFIIKEAFLIHATS